MFLFAIGVASMPFFQKYRSNIDLLLSARGTQNWAPVGFSLFAGAMGGWVIYAVPEVSVLMGPWGLIGYSLSMMIPYLALPMVTPLVLKRAPKGFTMLEFTRKRFGWVLYYVTVFITMMYLFIVLVAEYTTISYVVEDMVGYDANWQPLMDGYKVSLGIALMTAIYTMYGGLAISIFTDRIQSCIVLVFVVLACSAGFSNASSATHDKLQDSFASQWTAQGFGSLLVLIIGVFGSAAFDQAVWQRAYAAKNNQTLWKGCWFAVALICPVMLIFGFVGIVANAEFGTDSTPYYTSATGYMAFFDLVGSLGKGWKVVITIMAIMMTVSTADSYQNALTVVMTNEIEKLAGVLKIGWMQNHPMATSRVLALLIQGPAIALAYEKKDVIRLFLISNLTTAVLLVPVFAGLWNFVTEAGSVLGVIGGVASVVVYGWKKEGHIASGFDYLVIPQGLYSKEAIIIFFCAVFFSSIVTLAVSYAHRLYGNVYKTRRFVEMMAAKQGVDVANTVFAGIPVDDIWADKDAAAGEHDDDNLVKMTV
jgi:Na+/proline symporter